MSLCAEVSHTKLCTFLRMRKWYYCSKWDLQCLQSSWEKSWSRNCTHLQFNITTRGIKKNWLIRPSQRRKSQHGTPCSPLCHPFCLRRDIKVPGSLSLEFDVQLATKPTFITCPKDGNSGSVQICLQRFLLSARAATTQRCVSIWICCHIILSRKWWRNIIDLLLCHHGYFFFYKDQKIRTTSRESVSPSTTEELLIRLFCRHSLESSRTLFIFMVVWTQIFSWAWVLQ